MELYLICFLVGFIVGGAVCTWVYVKFIDKPEVVNNYEDEVRVRQKKGVFSNILKRNRQDKK